MANNFVFNDSLPVAPLKLAALESCKDFASKVDSHIVPPQRYGGIKAPQGRPALSWI